MSMVCGVIEKPLGANQPGDVIHCDADMLAALINAGVAREATEDDLYSEEPEEEKDEVKPVDNLEPEHEPEAHSAQVARQLANHAEQTVKKAVDKVAEKLLSDSRKDFHVPTNRIAGSDFLKTGGFKNLSDCALTWFMSAKGDWEAGKKFAKYGKAVDVHTKATGMSISGGSGHQGGDLVPQEWAENLWMLSFKDVPDLMGMMTRYEMRNQVENIPSWLQTSATSAITATVIGEASDITATVGATQNVQLSLQKFAALVF